MEIWVLKDILHHSVMCITQYLIRIKDLEVRTSGKRACIVPVTIIPVPGDKQVWAM